MSEILKVRQLSGSSFSENIKWIETALTAKENVPPKVCESKSPVKRKICIKDEKLETSTPKKSRQNLDEPVTPSSNFKLLTSLAASLDYADCDTPKVSLVFLFSLAHVYPIFFCLFKNYTCTYKRNICMHAIHA